MICHLNQHFQPIYPWQSPKPLGPITLKRGNQIPHLSEYWIIQSGIVRTITWDEDGMISVLGIWGPGDLLHPVPINIVPYQYECLATTVLRPIYEIQELKDLLIQQSLRVEELLALNVYRNVSHRLLKTLHWLSIYFGPAESDRHHSGRLIDIQLTHQQLADLAGTTRVTVTRCLGHFEREGKILRLKGGRILIQAP